MTVTQISHQCRSSPRESENFRELQGGLCLICHGIGTTLHGIPDVPWQWSKRAPSPDQRTGIDGEGTVRRFPRTSPIVPQSPERDAVAYADAPGAARTRSYGFDSHGASTGREEHGLCIGGVCRRPVDTPVRSGVVVNRADDTLLEGRGRRN
ncbi:hypothetical protein P170DRAFT_184705 [Aspergillus steynii IBT 23096]|uniref:Uncharacterized protein n=1 Tax=Aspergillus steynii IBT 23096 TaxID=1392250 RepID=A0A2I2G9B1_9EURO|nr:uncharacterized protein P170DRAFT_184705 [Aspergillus steynii IBT 23096]PLB49467.1 hypothetical protein P170DRAFT_184705 [Aspergillus steynii IBT 23096]